MERPSAPALRLRRRGLSSALSLERQSLAPFGLRLSVITRTVCQIVRGFDFGEPLHAVAWISAMMRLNVMPSASSETSRYLIFPSSADELPLLKRS